MKLTEFLSINPSEKPQIEENHAEEYAVIIVPELFKLNHKYGQLLNTDRKILSIDQSPNLVLMTSRETTNGKVSPKNFISDVISKIFTGEQTQAPRSINKNYNLIYKINNFGFMDSKMENKSRFNLRANKKIMDIIIKQDKGSQTVQLIEKRRKTTKPFNLSFKFGSNLNRKVRVP